MGSNNCCCGSKSHGNDKIDELHRPSTPNIFNKVAGLATHRREFAAMGLNEHDLAKLHEVFVNIDVDKSNTLDVNEMLCFMKKRVGQEERFPSAFAHAVFTAFDEDLDGAISFKEFVSSLWNYCTLEPSTAVTFAFDLYDADGNGQIDPEELQHMLQDIYGRTVRAAEMLELLHPVLGEEGETPKPSENATSGRQEKDATEEGELGERQKQGLKRKNSIRMESVRPLSLSDFIHFCESHPEVLKQVLNLQLMLQQQCNGLDFWRKKIDDCADLDQRQITKVHPSNDR